MTDTASRASTPPVLRSIVGQPRALRILGPSLATPAHAYLFVGPSGAGKLDAARRFAAALVCPNGGCGACGHCRDALAGLHPDVSVFEREGASITVGEAHQIALASQRAPALATRQVLILDEFHLVERAAPALLKTIEEPPETTVFLILADQLPKSLITIASRCVEVPFGPIDRPSIEAALAEMGVPAPDCAQIAQASLGNLERARLLASDPGFRARVETWRALPDRLDGTGASVAIAVGELLGGVEAIVEVVRARQADELAELEAAAKQAGETKVPGMRAIEERHRREQRRVRTDELRAGLAALQAVYFERISVPGISSRRLASLGEACAAIDEAAGWLVRNPNETLLLEALFLRLGALAS